MIKKKWDMFAESVSMSLSNIAGNKMRTFLTTLGIIIGVGAIIALMTVVQGATDTMNAQFDAMGLGTLRVSVAGTAINGHGLTDDDLQTILDCRTCRRHFAVAECDRDGQARERVERFNLRQRQQRRVFPP